MTINLIDEEEEDAVHRLKKGIAQELSSQGVRCDPAVFAFNARRVDLEEAEEVWGQGRIWDSLDDMPRLQALAAASAQPGSDVPSKIIAMPASPLAAWLFHVTPARNLASISRNGLSPSYARQWARALYLTDSIELCHSMVMDLGEPGAILRVRLADLDPAMLAADQAALCEATPANMPLQKMTWQESLSLCHQVAYCDDVAPQLLAHADGTLVVPMGQIARMAA